VTTIPSFVVYKKFDQAKAVYEGTFEPEDLAEFLFSNTNPIIMPFD